MNYQDYLDGLETLPADVKKYITKAVNRQNNSATVTLNRKYVDLIEKDSALLEAIFYLELLSPKEWIAVDKYYKSEL